MNRLPAACALALAVAACLAGPAAAQTTAPAAMSQDAKTSNPFFAPSPLEYNFPQFDKIKDADFAPAFDRGMAEQSAEIAKIADNPEAPTFDNTILAMERSGQVLSRAVLWHAEDRVIRHGNHTIVF